MPPTCTIELYEGRSWREAATVELRSGPSREQPTWLEYDVEYATAHLDRTGIAAVSERYPANFELYDVPTFPAFTVDLMPQGEARRDLVARLRRDGIRGSDFRVLRHGAQNPVGNLRVKEAVAEQMGDSPGVARAEVVQRGDAYREWAEAQGMAMTGASDTSTRTDGPNSHPSTISRRCFSIRS
jgi:hypothetical protein